MKERMKQGYIGNPAQLVTLRRVTVNEGKAKGTEIIEVKTAGGLALDILPDAGLDIGQCRYKGTNMSWMSKNGYDSPAVISPYEMEFLNTFPGGLLYTCGLRSAGPANRDGEEWHPQHGRYHSLAAEQISARMENDEIIMRGTVRETALFGHVLEVNRTLRIPVFGASVTVEDTVTNLTPRDEEIMQIYHCNFGYPLLSEKARLVLPQERETIPRTEFARAGLERACEFEKPVDGEEERVFSRRCRRISGHGWKTRILVCACICPGRAIRCRFSPSGAVWPAEIMSLAWSLLTPISWAATMSGRTARCRCSRPLKALRIR